MTGIFIIIGFILIICLGIFISLVSKNPTGLIIAVIAVCGILYVHHNSINNQIAFDHNEIRLDTEHRNLEDSKIALYKSREETVHNDLVILPELKYNSHHSKGYKRGLHKQHHDKQELRHYGHLIKRSRNDLNSARHDLRTDKQKLHHIK